MTVRATDAVGLTYDETFTITVTDVDEPPSITSNGGGAAAAISVAENSTVVTTVAATDPDAGQLTYSIIGGADQARFHLDGSSGVLTFLSPPDFENPTDVGADNVYELTVEASDGSNSDAQIISVTVTDVNEAPTDIALSNTSVPENAGADAVVGTLSGTDPARPRPYRALSGTARATSLDTLPTVTVRATDAVGLTYDTITANGTSVIDRRHLVAENSTAVTIGHRPRRRPDSHYDSSIAVPRRLQRGPDLPQPSDFETPTDGCHNVYEVTDDSPGLERHSGPHHHRDGRR